MKIGKVAQNAAPIGSAGQHSESYGDSSDPQWLWSGKVPCLDGLRAVAILFVVLSHLGRRELALGWELGHLGVTIFFVVSGFLITLLLLRERRKNGRVSLKSFYKRRALRILPAYIVFLATIGGFQAAGFYKYPASSWIAVVTYTSCFWNLSDIGHNLAHTWSLSVEEHFYLIWPLVFVYFRGRTAFLVLCGYFSLVPMLRWCMGKGYILALDPNYASPTQMGSITVGCILAFLIAGGIAPRAKAFVIEKPIYCLAAGGALILASRLLSPPLKLAFSDHVKASAFGLILIWILYDRRSALIQRCLANAPMVWIGVLSYSIYLWQQPLTEDPRIPGGRLVRLIILAAAAAGSYWIVEKPFLRLKKSYAV